MTKIYYFFTLIILFVCLPSANASTPTQSAEQITAILSKSGIETKTSAAFYQAGVQCHQGKLAAINYFSQKRGIFFFFNDTLKNCYFVFIPVPPPGQNISTLKSCIISDSQYQKMFTSWYLDALKNYDETHTLNPTAQQFIMEIADCLKPISGDELISILTESNTTN